MCDTQHKSINRTKIDRRIDKHFMQSYWSALHFAPTNLPVLYRGMPQASHGIRKIYCFRSFALDSAHVKFDVWTGPKYTYVLTQICVKTLFSFDMVPPLTTQRTVFGRTTYNFDTAYTIFQNFRHLSIVFLLLKWALYSSWWSIFAKRAKLLFCIVKYANLCH